jgi:hypothetical protein
MYSQAFAIIYRHESVPKLANYNCMYQLLKLDINIKYIAAMLRTCVRSRRRRRRPSGIV